MIRHNGHACEIPRMVVSTGPEWLAERTCAPIRYLKGEPAMCALPYLSFPGWKEGRETWSGKTLVDYIGKISTTTICVFYFP